MSYTGIDYAGANNEFLYGYAKYAGTPTATRTTTATNTSNSSGGYTSGIQDAGLFANKCTDGVDDGKISVVSAALNIGEGILGMGANLVKNALKHPFKTAAMAAVMCVPFFGPAIGAGLACYGIYSGGKAVLNAIDVANSATTDAEAKAAFENIGSGAATVGVSALGLKGSAGVFKNQVGEFTSQLAQSGGKFSFQALGEYMAKGTMNNIQRVATAPFKKAHEIYENLKDEATGKITFKSVGDYAQKVWNNKTDQIANKAKELGKKADDKLNELKGKNSGKETIPEGAKNLKTNGTFDAEGTIYTKTEYGYEIQQADGTTVRINAKGVKLPQELQGQNVHYDSSKGTYTVGDTTWESKLGGGYTVKNADGTVIAKYDSQFRQTYELKTEGNIRRTYNYENGKRIEVKTETLDANGNVTETQTLIDSKHNIWKSVKENETTVYDGASKNGDGYHTVKGDKTTYEYNGVKSKKLFSSEGIKGRLSVSPTARNVSDVIDTELPVLGEYTNPFLMGVEGLSWLEEMEN